MTELLSDAPSLGDVPQLTPEGLSELLLAVQNVGVAVIGDFCLDAYWFVDDSASETSLETSLPTQPVREQRYYLGGAGNVVNNLAALGCRDLYAFGVVGADPWGREMRRQLDEINVSTEHLLVQEEHWATPTYVKPHFNGLESARLDLGSFNVLDETLVEQLTTGLKSALAEVDVVIVNSQVRRGVQTPSMRRAVVDLAREHPDTPFIVDARYNIDDFTGLFLKVNESEAALLCNLNRCPQERIPLVSLLEATRLLFDAHGAPIVITRGGRGSIVWDASGWREVPAMHVYRPTDPVGAGDSMLAGIAAGIGAGAPPPVAALLGSYCAGVTIQKLNQTGTASPEEIKSIGTEPEFVLRPELAAEPRNARHLPNTDIEVIASLPGGLRITDALFDHDGTVSTLRQGWEDVIVPVMVDAILGPCAGTADEALLDRVRDRVRDYVSKSTGIQTLAQMHELAAMVREFGCVPIQDILTPEQYKRVYLDRLMEHVHDCLARLKRQERDFSDYTVKGSVELLHALRGRGVRLYLASGTDEKEVIGEAQALGYADLFDGGIFGSVGDIKKDAKRVVVNRILEGSGSCEARHVVTFGDGPVEIRETKKHGGYGVGVASDEVRRYGLNLDKRKRLIEAGADLVIPDFSQWQVLLETFTFPG